MKYHKKFKIRDDSRKLHRRIQTIKEFLKGKTMISITQEPNCIIKTVKKWIDNNKDFIYSKKTTICEEIALNLMFIPNQKDMNYQFHF